MPQVHKLGVGVKKLGVASHLGGTSGPRLLGAARAAAEAEAKTKQEDRLAREVRDAARHLNESVRDVANRLNSEIQSDYYHCVVYQNREQRLAFEAATGVKTAPDGLYVDGQELAKALGIDLPPGPPEWREATPSKTWEALARPVTPLPEDTSGGTGLEDPIPPDDDSRAD